MDEREISLSVNRNENEQNGTGTALTLCAIEREAIQFQLFLAPFLTDLLVHGSRALRLARIIIII